MGGSSDKSGIEIDMPPRARIQTSSLLARRKKNLNSSPFLSGSFSVNTDENSSPIGNSFAIETYTPAAACEQISENMK
jgi:hypothetical protein